MSSRPGTPLPHYCSTLLHCTDWCASVFLTSTRSLVHLFPHPLLDDSATFPRTHSTLLYSLPPPPTSPSPTSPPLPPRRPRIRRRPQYWPIAVASSLVPDRRESELRCQLIERSHHLRCGRAPPAVPVPVCPRDL